MKNIVSPRFSSSVCYLATAILSFSGYGLCAAPLSMGAPFQDGAVLQRDKPVHVWGFGNPEETVTVSFHGNTVAAKADVNGRWLAQLPAMPAAKTGAELTAYNGAQTCVVRDVLVGEVWLCSGQSNMAFTVDRVNNAAAEIKNAQYPLIRQFLVRLRIAEAPQAAGYGAWSAATPVNVGQFSGVAYFFGRSLYQDLDVPIGLINASVGGTGVLSWMSAEGRSQDPHAAEINAAWQEILKNHPAQMEKFTAQRAAWLKAKAEADASGKSFTRKPPRRPAGPGEKNQLSGLYNGMIAPLVPYTLRGIIWYQGEHDIFHYDQYATLFPGLITQWRADFGQGDIPFYFVQLPNRDHELDKTKMAWCFQRETQAKALSLPNTGMAVTIDVGDSKDTHPKNKQDVGARLALIALAKTYGLPVKYAGPVLKDVKMDGSCVRLTFENAEGLQLRPAASSGFELCGADGVYHDATAKVEGASVVLTSPAVSAPAAARYAWRNDPSVTLFNASGLPASPFRTRESPAEKPQAPAGGGEE